MTAVFVIFAIFLGISSMVAVPLGVLLGVPLLAWNLRALIRLKEREIDLRRLETAARLRHTHHGELPHYVDASDPNAVLAWAQADQELAMLR